MKQQLRGFAERAGNAALKRTIGLRGRVPGRVEVRPSFMVIGGQGPTSTSLYRHLKQHPNFVAPARKGIHYFDKNYARGDDWYWAHFPTARPGRFTVDATPYYLFHPLAPQRAAATMPHIKIVLLLQDPVSRAHTHHGRALERGHETLPLAEAIDAEPERLAGEREKIIANPRYLSFAHEQHSYMSRGRYFEQILAWYGVFPSNQILILTSEELATDRRAQLRKLTDFVGVEPLENQRVSNLSTTTEKSLPDGLANRMAAYFEEDNQRLFELLGRELEWHRPQ